MRKAKGKSHPHSLRPLGSPSHDSAKVGIAPIVWAPSKDPVSTHQICDRSIDRSIDWCRFRDRGRSRKFRKCKTVSECAVPASSWTAVSPRWGRRTEDPKTRVSATAHGAVAREKGGTYLKLSPRGRKQTLEQEQMITNGVPSP